MSTTSLRESLNAELAASSALLRASLPALAHVHAAYRKRLDPRLAVMACLARAGYTAEASPLLDLCRATRGDRELNSALVRCAHGARRRTRLMHAAHSSDAARLAFLLSCRGDLLPRSSPQEACVNQADALGHTALHYAASAGSGRCAALLLAVARVSTGAAQPGGITPLHCACAAGSLRVVRALLAGGAEVDAVGAWEDEGQPWQPHCQSTPLGIACVTGHAGVARALLQGGANADQRLAGGLACSAGSCSFSECAEDRWRGFVSHMLVMRSIDVWGGGPALRDSPLYVAMMHKHESVLRELLEGGAQFCNSAVAFSTGEIRALLEHFKYKKKEEEEEEQQGNEQDEGVQQQQQGGD